MTNMVITTVACEVHHECIVTAAITAASDMTLALHLRHDQATMFAHDILTRVRDATV